MVGAVRGLVLELVHEKGFYILTVYHALSIATGDFFLTQTTFVFPIVDAVTKYTRGQQNQ